MDKLIHASQHSPEVETKTMVFEKTIHIPMYDVILMDDDEHTYDYVIEMLMDVFGHQHSTAYEMACKVDSAGWVIVNTTHKDRAELKKDQVHAYGADWRMPNCKGSMTAIIEPSWSE